MTKYEERLFAIGFLILLLITIIAVFSIPARGRIQGDLESIKSETSQNFSEVDSLCDNNCEPPYSKIMQESLSTSGGLPTADEKEFCLNQCKDRKELKRLIGLELIFNKYPYMVRNKFYFYSSILNCLLGFGGCPAGFLREEFRL